ncbi:MAG: sulfonate transport system substrate-binding protein [Archaeoglobi archaeon]|nr:ABC transporter substrate-binding protein [Candidatus Mnemosynella bozhongmuii]MDI3502457.1 sulfonate transport system substrate-binding protein [Archaeoglobi archaeon]MDK2781088.1 sulfonate transport system substrate-binding protein [Archaeoglobi archaeon]
MKGKALSLILIAALLSVALSGCTETREGNEVYVVKLSPADMRNEMLSGEIDGFIAWEPYNAEVVVRGEGEYLVQSGEIWPNHPCCILAVSDEVAKDEKLLRALVWAHVKATRFINDPGNYEKVIQYAVEFTGKDREVVEEAMKHIKFIEFPDEQEFRNYYERLREGGFLERTVEELGYASEDEFFDDFLMREAYDYVVQKLSEDPSWVPEKPDREINMGHLTADLHELAWYVALKEGYFEKAGIRGDLEKQYANGPMAMEAFKAGEIDVSYLGGAPATLKRINDDIRIHIVAGANNEGSAIVVSKNSGIKSIEDLRGKTIAIPGFGTVQDFILRMALEQHNLEVRLKE